MNGIAALFHRNGKPVDRAEIWSVIDAVPYRGLDGMSVHCDGPIGLGLAKTVITPEDEHEQQPIVSLRTGCAIIADIRLDNRSDLLATLSDLTPGSVGDAEIVLRLYELHGTRAFPMLIGDFAIVIWDPRNRHVVCARDTGGQRTLYYRHDARTFAAASEIHQLFQDPAVPIVANDEVVMAALTPFNALRNERDSATTFYEGIFAVPAAHVLVVDERNESVDRYWDLLPDAEIRYRSDSDYEEHFRSIFSSAVRDRMRSSRPLSMMLSGGLDSSSVMSVSQQLLRLGGTGVPSITSFSLTFDELDCDERPYIEDHRQMYGFCARYASADRGPSRLILRPEGFHESPRRHVSEKELLLAAAVDAGHRLMLTGDGGDSLEGSPNYLDIALRDGRLRDFNRYAAMLRNLEPRPSLARLLAMHTALPMLPLAIQNRIWARHAERQIRRLWLRLTPQWMPLELKHELARRHLDESVRAAHNRRFLNTAREQLRANVTPPEILRQPVGWPIEIASPYTDRRLHEFLVAIPPDQLFEPNSSNNYYARSRWLLRRAMRGILPESIRTRTHQTIFTGFTQDETTRNWPLYEAAFNSTEQPLIAQRGYIDAPQFSSRLRSLARGAHGSDTVYIKLIIGLESWLRSLEQPQHRIAQVSPRTTRMESRARHA